MRMEHVVKLRTLLRSQPTQVGFRQNRSALWRSTPTKKSVRQSEYYAADAQGKRLDMVLVINADDWNGATEVEVQHRV